MFNLYLETFEIKTKQNGGKNGSTVVRCTQKLKPDSFSGGQAHSDKHVLILFLY